MDHNFRLINLGVNLGVVPKDTIQLISLMLEMADAYYFSLDYSKGEGYQATFGQGITGISAGSKDTIENAVISSAEEYFAKRQSLTT